MAQRGNSREDMRRIIRRKEGRSPFAVGLLVLVLTAVVVYFGFTKAIPFQHDHRIKAVFANANSIKPNSFVRIAGVNVGKVTKVERYKDTNASVVTMEIKDSGLPIHTDATFKIRPRIFLEGNFFVEARPGSPSAPTVKDNGVIPMTQTSNPVQLDNVLTALQTDTREDLKQLLDGLGTALNAKPTAADDRDQDPDVRGKSVAQALNELYDTAPRAEKNGSYVNQALLGTQRGDLAKLIKSFGTVAGALDRNETQLKDLISNFNTTVAAFASESGNLQASIRQLAPTLQTTNRTLDDLNAAFPATRAFAREILPGVRETPATIAASFPWIEQTRKLLGNDELRGLARELRPTARDTARLIDRSYTFLPQLDLINRCLKDVILPTGDIVVQDGNLTTGVENYKEFWYTMVGIASEGANFDGNGMYVRFQPGGGLQTVSTGTASLSGETFFGNAIEAPSGTTPKFTGKRPPYVSTVPCYKSGIPAVNGPLGRAGGVESVKARASKSGGQLTQIAAAAARKRAAAAGSSGGASGSGTAGKGSLTDELVQAINPFRGAVTEGAKP